MIDSPLAEAGAWLGALSVGAMLFAVVRVVGRARHAGHARSRVRLSRIGGEAVAASGVPSSAATVLRTRRGPAAPAVRAWVTSAGLEWEPVDILLLTALSALIPALITLALTRAAVPAVVVALLGALGPALLIRRKAARRRRLMSEQVVDTVELVASSLRAGFGVVQGLELAAREQPEPMSGELRRVVREINLGGSTEDALGRFAQRAADVDVSLVTTAVLVQRRVGGDLSEVLLNLAGTIRERIRVRGEVQALTAQARMSAWVVGLLPVALAGALFILSPQHVGLLITDPAGRIIAGGALMLELVGFWLVQRVARIDY